MIKPVEITPSYTSNWLEFSCEKCGDSGVLNTLDVIDVDRDGEAIQKLEYNCRICGEGL